MGSTWLLWVALLGACGRTTPTPSTPRPPAQVAPSAPLYPLPPLARRTADVARLHGIELPDPYRWLEDTASEETAHWVAEQNAATDGFFATMAQWAPIRRRLEILSSFEQISVPSVRGGRYLFLRTARPSDQPALIMTPTLGGPETTVLDADRLSPDGLVSIVDFVPSNDARLVAVGLARGGSDSREWHVYDVDRQVPTSDVIRWTRSARPSWSADGRGFYYTGSSEHDDRALAERALAQRIYYHRRGAAQAEDAMILELASEPEWRPQPLVTSDGRLLLVTISHGVGSGKRVLVRRLSQPDSPFVTLSEDFEDDFALVAARRDVVWFLTTSGASRGHLVAIDVNHPERNHWRVVLPEQPDTLQAVVQVRERFVAATLHDAISQLAVYDEQGAKVAAVALPEPGTVRSLRGVSGSDEVLFSLSSFRMPPTVYRLDSRTRALTTVHRPQVAFRVDDFRTEQVFVEADDGTRLPVFLTASREVALRAEQPTYLTAYGGFGRSTTPTFTPEQILWLELGGVLATAVIRGGGEYGTLWHEQGRRRKKVRAIDDFIQVAEWLVANRVTTSERLAIGGSSNGGLLVGATVVRRPDLAAAVVADVGLYDMARFHRLGVGWQWVDEYGSPEAADDFAILRQYSPYHNVRPATAYPATLVTTADGDDRVAPSHSFKFVAALQAAQAGPAAVLLRFASGSGHGAGVARHRRVQEAAARWMFVAHALGMDLSAWTASNAANDRDNAERPCAEQRGAQPDDVRGVDDEAARPPEASAAEPGSALNTPEADSPQ